MAWDELHPKVDDFLEKTKWRAEAERLRAVLLGAGLTEEWKWAKPCYSLEGRKIAVIQTMKESIALMFFAGWALSDPKKVLAKMGEHTEVGRWIKFTSEAEVKALEPVLKAYVREAMEVEISGAAAKKPERKALELPEELETAMKSSAALKKAFAALTPGRQRAYAIVISKGKKTETRAKAVEKYVPRILAGLGPLER